MRALFTLGDGLGVEDAHILDKIPKGNIGTVCLGAFDQWEADAFRRIADPWIAARKYAGRPALKVHIFSTKDVVWGPRQRTS